MNINVDIMEYIRDFVKDLLDEFSDILVYEKQYDYYIDEVALLINPNTVNVFLFVEDLKKTKKYLTGSGLNIIVCKNKKYGENYSVYYKDMLNIRVTDNRNIYNEAKNKNDKMESISLTNVVKSLQDKGLPENVIIDRLLGITEYK